MIYYTVKVYKEAGYTFTKLFVFQGEAKTVRDLIKGIVENKDGYQNSKLAEVMKGRFEVLREKGYWYVVEPSHYKGKAELQWQHYEPGARHDGRGYAREYCEVNVELRPRYDAITQGMKLVNKLCQRVQRNRCWHSLRVHDVVPAQIIEALKHLRAQPVKLVRCGEYDMRYCYTRRVVRSKAAKKAAPPFPPPLPKPIFADKGLWNMYIHTCENGHLACSNVSGGSCSYTAAIENGEVEYWRPPRDVK